MVDTAIRAYMKDMTPEQKTATGDEIKAICGIKNYTKVTDTELLLKLYNRFNKE